MNAQPRVTLMTHANDGWGDISENSPSHRNVDNLSTGSTSALLFTQVVHGHLRTFSFHFLLTGGPLDSSVHPRAARKRGGGTRASAKSARVWVSLLLLVTCGRRATCSCL